MKMQALYQSTKTDNTYRLLEVVSKEHKCKCDQIPPAYPCENEACLHRGRRQKARQEGRCFL